VDNIVLVIMLIVALACLSALCIYMILVLMRVRSLLTTVEKDIKELSSKAIPVFENLEVITDKVKNVTETIDEQVQTVKDSINAVKEVADSIVTFEKRVQERIEEPVLDIVSVFVSIVKGVRTFFERLRA
jgi:uncharacterized protein YoxC